MINLLFNLGIRKRLFLMGWVLSIVIATPPILLFSNNKLLAIGCAVAWSLPVLVVFYMISKMHITKPIEELARELEKIGKGDLSRKIDIKLKVLGREVNDEFKDLNESVNKMQAGLSSLVKLVENLSETSHQLIGITMPLFYNLATMTETMEAIKLPENIEGGVKAEIDNLMSHFKKCITDMEEVSKKASALVELSDELKKAAGMFKI